jgi:retron-type reverse transcriptase
MQYFLDFEKAFFDKVPHDILIHKIKHIIDDVKVVNILIDFLTNRTQKVKVAHHLSREIRVTSGVPQGSVLGPLLFTIFINDLSSALSSKVRLFADDSVIYKTIGNIDDERLLQEDLYKVGEGN